jgi:hypothetical protein
LAQKFVYDFYDTRQILFENADFILFVSVCASSKRQAASDKVCCSPNPKQTRRKQEEDRKSIQTMYELVSTSGWQP